MLPREPAPALGWHASLDLGYESREGRTVPALRRHCGPLRVQKPFYPEGGNVCHSIVLHPPGGICGGDALELSVGVGAGACALLTTPGAGKWYRSAGAEARQSLRFHLAEGASLEWLPQESIVFDGARAVMTLGVDLAPGARYLGWDIVCLGRRGSGETFSSGSLGIETRVDIAQEPRWLERGVIEGGSGKLGSPAVLAGATVFGHFLLAGEDAPPDLLERCRALEAAEGLGAVTALPGLLVARYLGHEAEAARSYFSALWREARPAILGRDAVTPRIWMT